MTPLPHVDISAPEMWNPDRWIKPSGLTLTWAKQNCASFVKVSEIRVEGQLFYRFFFLDEQDASWFALKWS